MQGNFAVLAGAIALKRQLGHGVADRDVGQAYRVTNHILRQGHFKAV